MAETQSKASKSSSSSSSSSNKNVWSALEAVVDYITRHGDEGGNALRQQVAELRPGKTHDVVAEDDPSVADNA